MWRNEVWGVLVWLGGPGCGERTRKGAGMGGAGGQRGGADTQQGIWKIAHAPTLSEQSMDIEPMVGEVSR